MAASTLRIALAQFDFPVGDVAGNARRIAAMIATARDEYGADLVLFPELAVSGYPPEDLLLRPAFLAACERALHDIAAACKTADQFRQHAVAEAIIRIGFPACLWSVAFLFKLSKRF